MNFNLTDEQAMVLKMVKDLAQNEIAPRAAYIDESGEFPKENIEALSELGLMGMTIPTEYGGSFMDNLSYIMAVEEISKACASTGAVMSIHSSTTCNAIVNFGTEAQKHQYLPSLAGEGKIAAFALTEADSGSDAASIKTNAVLEGDTYILNGTKCFISNSGVADLYTIFAKTDRNSGVKGISAFIVEKDTPGLTIGKKENKMGIRGSITCELIIEDLRIPKENLLGKEGQGFKIAMVALDSARIGAGAQAVGIAQAAYETALQYAKERKQFGRPIIDFQGIGFMLADMAMQIEAARLLVYKAASLKDEGKPFGMEAAMCKTFASDMSVKVALDAIQVLGGYGYMKEYPTERYLRDAKITQIYEGTNQIQRVVICNYLKSL